MRALWNPNLEVREGGGVMATQALAELLADVLTGEPPKGIRCAQCGERLTPTTASVWAHFEGWHGWRFVTTSSVLVVDW